MSFVAGPQPTTPAQLIQPAGFWPALTLSAAREQLAVVDGTVTDARLADALTAAVLTVNQRLQSLPIVAAAAGIPSLEAWPGPQQGPTSRSYLYRRAVYETTLADLAERYTTYDPTQRAEAHADTRQATADNHRRNATWAIADLLGRPRTVVELL